MKKRDEILKIWLSENTDFLSEISSVIAHTEIESGLKLYDLSKRAMKRWLASPKNEERREAFNQLLRFQLLYLSFENYNPTSATEILEGVRKYCRFDINHYYGWHGYNQLHKAPGAKPDSSIIASATFHFLEYLILNRDFRRLERFLTANRKVISDHVLHAASLICAVEKGSDPAPQILAHAFLGGNRKDPKEVKSLGLWNFPIDGIVALYFEKKKLPLNHENLIELFSKVLVAKRRHDRRWFLKEYLEREPFGVSLERLDVGNQAPMFSCLDYRIWYPRWHRYHRGFPSIRGKIGGPPSVYNDLRNYIREEIGLPKIGEGWVSETALYYKVKDWFQREKVVHHWRPRFLGRQHIDIGLPEVKIGIEYHGTQHFEPVDFFGGQKSFEAQQERDKRKASLCDAHSVNLLVFTDSDTDDLIRATVEKAISKAKRSKRR